MRPRIIKQSKVTRSLVSAGGSLFFAVSSSCTSGSSSQSLPLSLSSFYEQQGPGKSFSDSLAKSIFACFNFMCLAKYSFFLKVTWQFSQTSMQLAHFTKWAVQTFSWITRPGMICVHGFFGNCRIAQSETTNNHVDLEKQKKNHLIERKYIHME